VKKKENQKQLYMAKKEEEERILIAFTRYIRRIPELTLATSACIFEACHYSLHLISYEALIMTSTKTISKSQF
jgi:hypothetical protein